MPPSTTTELERIVRSITRAGTRLPTESALAPLRAASFYTAIALPFVYLPLIATGLSVENAPLVAALVAANVVTLVLGHGYGAD